MIRTRTLVALVVTLAVALVAMEASANCVPDDGRCPTGIVVAS